MTILLIVAGLTLQLFNSTLDSDRIKTGARELQSYIAGARDRAAYAGQPRGVRFLPDPVDRATVTSFVYIGAPSLFGDGTITINPPLGSLPNTIIAPAAWSGFRDRGLLPDGSRIHIAGDPPTQWYTLAFSAGAWSLTSLYAGPAPLSSAIGYQLELAPAVLQGEEPRSLPVNSVIDLRSSVLPASWGGPLVFTPPFDLLFSPQGTVIGPAASDGRIHFVLSDAADTTGQVAIVGLSNRLQLNAPWIANFPYQVGNVVVPDPASYLAFRCVASATSGPAVPPAFATATTNQFIDDGVPRMWQCFTKRPNLILSVATATGRVTTHPVFFARTTTWSPSAPYSVGTTVQPTNPNLNSYVCTTAGTSAATEPIWPTASGATVADGTVVWTQSGVLPDSFRYAEIGEVTQ